LVDLVPGLVFDVLSKLCVGWDPLSGGKGGGLGGKESLTKR
jgi:hypothetical protein